MQRRSYLKNPTKQTAISVIHEAGGHLVLCRARAQGSHKAKSPYWSRWQRSPAPLDLCLAHDGPLGLVPWSIGTSALDVDRGDWRKLPRSLVNYGTRSKAGRHCYYSDDQPRRSQNWKANGCSGEVRGATGYLILWRDGAARIAVAITGPRQWSLFPFPYSLLESRNKGRVLQFPERAVNPYRNLDLERVHKGARNDSLFAVVRLRAYRDISEYRRERGADLAGWLRLVCTFTDDHNRRFPRPLRLAEVRSTSYSVATWVWSRFDHSPDKQSERGIKSGVSRRKGTPLEDDQRPWESMGISRAWWYRRHRHAQE